MFALIKKFSFIWKSKYAKVFYIVLLQSKNTPK